MTSNPQPNRGDRPAVPPRPNEQFSANNFMAPRYGAYGPPAPYFGMSGPNMSPYNMPFIANAHQQIDTTFQSIQSIVQAFSSISMMLESTYMAVHSSFRAVMDVADHFVRLKDSLAGILSITAMFNTIKWFLKRILYMLNMVGEEQIWKDSLTSATDAIRNGQQSIIERGRSQSSWTMLMFLGAAIGAPYMIYQIQKPTPVSTKWMTQEDSHYIGQALYDFTTNHEGELQLKAGQRVIIAPKEQQPRVSDWFLATIDGKTSGLIPMNYVKIIKFEIVK